MFGTKSNFGDDVREWDSKTGERIIPMYIHVRTVPSISLQIYCNLRPLRVCMSYQGTLNLIDTISEDHDIDIQIWADELKPLIQPSNVRIVY